MFSSGISSTSWTRSLWISRGRMRNWRWSWRKWPWLNSTAMMKTMGGLGISYIALILIITFQWVFTQSKCVFISLKSWRGEKEEESSSTCFLRHLRLLRHARHGGLSHADAVSRFSTAHHLSRQPQRWTAVLRHLWGVRSLDRFLQRWPNLLKIPSSPPPDSRQCTDRFPPEYTLFLYTAYIYIYTFRPLVHSCKPVHLKAKVCCIHVFQMFCFVCF